MREFIKQFLRNRGVLITRMPGADLIRRTQILENYNIDVLFDVGANIGQYAQQMRFINYNKKIVSFEPLSKAYGELKETAAKDPQWTACNFALGHEDTQSKINIAGNSYSSSLLDMKEAHVKAAPESEYVAEEEIAVKKLDSVIDDHCSKTDRIMLKVDTQGYEKHVIEGASKSLDRIVLIQLEMSILELYDKEMLMADMINFLDKQGFQLIALENGYENTKTHELIQVDGIFVNRRFAIQ